MKVREHRGSLIDSMNTVKNINPSIDSLFSLIIKVLPFLSIKKDDIGIEYYGYDSRIEWNTYIVTIDNYGVFGFTNEPLIN